MHFFSRCQAADATGREVEDRLLIKRAILKQLLIRSPDECHHAAAGTSSDNLRFFVSRQITKAHDCRSKRANATCLTGTLDQIQMNDVISRDANTPLGCFLRVTELIIAGVVIEEVVRNGATPLVNFHTHTDFVSVFGDGVVIVVQQV